MTGSQYEQFVRALLIKKLGLSATELRSAKEPGATLPSGDPITHQIDLLYVERSEVADYLTIIECKYRTSAPVDQEEVAKLAFVKGSVRAAKAVLVTNTEFTRGAQALADAERVALLIARPDAADVKLSRIPSSGNAEEIFAAIERALAHSSANHDVVVVKRLTADPREGGRDLLALLAADPTVRAMAESAVRDPSVRSQIERAARDNPELAKKALDFLRRGRF